MERREDNTGEFPFKLWFEKGEIDRLMQEHFDAYCKKVKPEDVLPLNVDLFIESYMEANFNGYASIDDKDVLGITKFTRSGGVSIQINSQLSDEADKEGYEGRYNFTVCHEAFHALYHNELYPFVHESQREFGTVDEVAV